MSNTWPIVEEKLIVELKCVDRIGGEHLAQSINYLKAIRPWCSSDRQLSKAQSGMETRPSGPIEPAQDWPAAFSSAMYRLTTFST
jgi:hypothetical protein